MSSASSVSDARKNGVAPVSFARVLLRFGFFVMRALTFAPFATSFCTSSMLDMLPDPAGAGSLSPTPGLRTR
jgi:hypothetical protein